RAAVPVRSRCPLAGGRVFAGWQLRAPARAARTRGGAGGVEDRGGLPGAGPGRDHDRDGAGLPAVCLVFPAQVDPLAAAQAGTVPRAAGTGRPDTGPGAAPADRMAGRTPYRV